MEFTKYTRKPFTVEATEVTEDNLEEIAKLSGMIKVDDRGKRYIEVNPNKIPIIPEVYPGFFLTKMNGNLRFYKRNIFLDQFEAIQ